MGLDRLSSTLLLMLQHRSITYIEEAAWSEGEVLSSMGLRVI